MSRCISPRASRRTILCTTTCDTHHVSYTCEARASRFNTSRVILLSCTPDAIIIHSIIYRTESSWCRALVSTTHTIKSTIKRSRSSHRIRAARRGGSRAASRVGPGTRRYRSRTVRVRGARSSVPAPPKLKVKTRRRTRADARPRVLRARCVVLFPSVILIVSYRFRFRTVAETYIRVSRDYGRNRIPRVVVFMRFLPPVCARDRKKTTSTIGRYIISLPIFQVVFLSSVRNAYTRRVTMS